MKLKFKIVLLALSSLIIASIMIGIIINLNKATISRQITQDMEEFAIKELTTISQDIYRMLDTQHQILIKKLHADLNVANHVLAQNGDIKFSRQQVKWEATNQFTKETQVVNLPKMMVGNTWLEQNTNMNIKSPLVDDIQNLVGGTCTVFQKMNPQGDMLRVSTNVEKLDGTRAIGTYIPAVNPDGKANPVIAKVMSGETFLEELLWLMPGTLQPTNRYLKMKKLLEYYMWESSKNP